MSDTQYGTAMTDEEVDAFLHEQGTGVLSLTQEGAAYGIPVSFGYDPMGDRCLLDLGFGPQSKKETFLDATETGCLTAYELTSPTDWRSVILTGTVRRLDDRLDGDTEERYYENASDVSISVFDHTPAEIDLSWYSLEIQTRSGRSSG